MSTACLEEENKLLKQEIYFLQQQIALLKQKFFGHGKSEKLDKNQLILELEDTQIKESPEEMISVSYERSVKRKAHAIREESYEHIPVEKTVIVEPKEIKECPDAWELVGADTTFELGIHPPKLYRIAYVYPKYRQKQNKELPLVRAPALRRPVQGIASANLLTYIVLNKYMDHLPLYRQEKILSRYGGKISRQNMVNWVSQVAEWLNPIYNHMRRELLSGNYLQIDETPIRVLDPDNGLKKIRQGWLWPISRPGSDVIFSWSVTRASSHLDEILSGFKGYLQSDGYSAYSKYISENEGIIPVACMAHIRRKFKEAETEGSAPLSILQSIAKLYSIEEDLKTREFHEAYHARQNQALPILNELHEKILSIRKDILPQSLTGKACDYALSQWNNLKNYTQDGQIRIDNNLIENAIRPSAIGKKNWLFIGHPNAGERSAIIYSILISCQRHNIDPYQYLNDVLEKAPYLVNKDQYHLTPKNWKHP